MCSIFKNDIAFCRSGSISIWQLKHNYCFCYTRNLFGISRNLLRAKRTSAGANGTDCLPLMFWCPSGRNTNTLWDILKTSVVLWQKLMCLGYRIIIGNIFYEIVLNKTFRRHFCASPFMPLSDYNSNKFQWITNIQHVYLFCMSTAN